MSESDDQNNQPEAQAAEPTTPPPSPEPEPSSGGNEPGSEERTWALFAHLSALIGFVIPFGNLIGPLIVWQVKKNEMPFVDEQGKEALNFQITVTLAAIVCFILMFVLIGVFLIFVVGIAALVLTIIAGIKANNGEHYQYPLTWRIIS